jgi:hypothetical protein
MADSGDIAGVGNFDARTIMQTTLNEEGEANKKLTTIAESNA